MINPANNTTIWYCNIKKEKVNIVKQNGLQCFSDPISGAIPYRTPWITVTTEPVKDSGIICEIDLADILEQDTKWVFDPKGNKKRLRIFEDITADKVKIIKEADQNP